jgi:hypothetical protein
MMFVSNELRKLANKVGKLEDLPTRQLALGSIITKVFEDNGFNAPILVGGMAVSVYSQGLYKTVDLDFLSNAEGFNELLFELGYKKLGKDFYNDSLSSYVEFPTPVDFPTLEKVRQFVVPETSLPLNVIGVEDLVLDRAGSFAATNSLECKEWSYRLMSVFYKYMDWGYLHKKAKQMGILKQVNVIQREVKGSLKQHGLLTEQETTVTTETSSRIMKFF